MTMDETAIMQVKADCRISQEIKTPGLFFFKFFCFNFV